MWDLIVSIPDHSLTFYFTRMVLDDLTKTLKHQAAAVYYCYFEKYNIKKIMLKITDKTSAYPCLYVTGFWTPGPSTLSSQFVRVTGSVFLKDTPTLNFSPTFPFSGA